jgi:uncharacterized protein YqgC (DUF456 family)
MGVTTVIALGYWPFARDPAGRLVAAFGCIEGGILGCYVFMPNRVATLPKRTQRMLIVLIGFWGALIACWIAADRGAFRTPFRDYGTVIDGAIHYSDH